jgi:hypothetical protein
MKISPHPKIEPGLTLMSGVKHHPNFTGEDTRPGRGEVCKSVVLMMSISQGHWKPWIMTSPLWYSALEYNSVAFQVCHQVHHHGIVPQLAAVTSVLDYNRRIILFALEGKSKKE